MRYRGDILKNNNMSEKKFYVDINLQNNEVNNLKADTLDINSNLASANTKRIVYWAGDYYYSDGTNWVQMSGGGGGGVATSTNNLFAYYNFV